MRGEEGRGGDIGGSMISKHPLMKYLSKEESITEEDTLTKFVILQNTPSAKPCVLRNNNTRSACCLIA